MLHSTDAREVVGAIRDVGFPAGEDDLVRAAREADSGPGR
ncbi:hypothetical protein GCM10010279_60760 [Streptomyces mutabilis]|nr:hypothetical protein GCM10010279_60760 [Streptomyces mutabilis]